MLLIVLGLFLGVPGTFIAVGLLIFASRTRHHQRGYTASRIALGLSLASAVMTSTLTVLPLANWAFYNRPFTTDVIVDAFLLGAIQVLTALGAIRSRRRHRAHLPSEGAASVALPGDAGEGRA